MMLLTGTACCFQLIGGCKTAPTQPDTLVKGNNQPMNEPKLQAGEIRLTGNISSISAPNKSFEIAFFTSTLANGQTSIIEVAKKKVVNVTAQTIIVRRDIQRRETPVKIAFSDVKRGDVAIVTGADSETGKPLNARLIEVLIKPQTAKNTSE